MSDAPVLDPDVDPEYHLKYDTVEMPPEAYAELDVKKVVPPRTPNFNINSLFENLPENDKEVRRILLLEKWFKENVPPDQAQHLMAKWTFWARPNQIAPPGFWTYWLLLAGRGFGKTRTGAEWIHQKVEDGTAKRIALVAPTAADVRKVMVEGESGLIATAKPWNRPIFEPSKLQLTWPNGAIAQMFSAEEPERLRGPQCDTFWADELAAWKNMQETWDMLQFGFRLGKHPQGCITTTPKPVPIVKMLVKQQLEEAQDTQAEKTIALTKGSTYDNRGNLAAPFFKQVVTKYEGTRLGRQELDAEILEDMPGALWNRGSLDGDRVRTNHVPVTHEDFKGLLEAEEANNQFTIDMLKLRMRASDIIKSVGENLSRIVVAVDPNASNDEKSDEIGIVVSGKGTSGKGYVLADLSMRGTPNEWASTAVLAHDVFTADRIIGEANQGGNMVEHTITSAAKFLRIARKRPSDFVGVTLVHATRGKVTRAEPVSALYEQHRVSHIGTFATLEDQMCLFTSDFDRKAMGYSPDRVDALVWSITHLFLENDNTGLLEFYQQQAAHKQAIEAKKSDPGNFVVMSVPSNISRVFGKSGVMYSVADGVVNVKPDDVPGLRSAGLKEVM